ncbi:hypothetical protein PCE1_001823 [Barthelona sp. PCE]
MPFLKSLRNLKDKITEIVASRDPGAELIEHFDELIEEIAVYKGTVDMQYNETGIPVKMELLLDLLTSKEERKEMDQNAGAGTCLEIFFQKRMFERMLESVGMDDHVLLSSFLLFLNELLINIPSFLLYKPINTELNIFIESFYLLIKRTSVKFFKKRDFFVNLVDSYNLDTFMSFSFDSTTLHKEGEEEKKEKISKTLLQSFSRFLATLIDSLTNTPDYIEFFRHNFFFFELISFFVDFDIVFKSLSFIFIDSNNPLLYLLLKEGNLFVNLYAIIFDCIYVDDTGSLSCKHENILSVVSKINQVFNLLIVNADCDMEQLQKANTRSPSTSQGVFASFVYVYQSFLLKFLFPLFKKHTFMNVENFSCFCDICTCLLLETGPQLQSEIIKQLNIKEEINLVQSFIEAISGDECDYTVLNAYLRLLCALLCVSDSSLRVLVDDILGFTSEEEEQKIFEPMNISDFNDIFTPFQEENDRNTDMELLLMDVARRNVGVLASDCYSDIDLFQEVKLPPVKKEEFEDSSIPLAKFIAVLISRCTDLCMPENTMLLLFDMIGKVIVTRKATMSSLFTSSGLFAVLVEPLKLMKVEIEKISSVNDKMMEVRYFLECNSMEGVPPLLTSEEFNILCRFTVLEQCLMEISASGIVVNSML